MIQQLKLLADEKNVYQSYVFYLVESLATVKSVVLLLDVDDSKGSRERLLQQLFGLVFDLAPLPHVSRTAKLYLLEISQTLIDESDSISSDIVRFIMQKCGDIRQETRVFAADLVRLCSDKLQPSLGLLFNEAVLEYSGDRSDQQQKRLEPLKQVHLQIIQVGRAVPAAVASVVAQLEEELQTADTDLRMLALNSLPAFFTAPDSDVPKMYNHLWQTWLNKMNDKITAVRLQWFKLSVSMLSELGLNYRLSLQKALSEKLLDIDAKVREKSLLLLKRFLEEGNSPTLLGMDIIEGVGGRCRDKVPEVQFVAVDLLCDLIHRQFQIDPNNDCFSLAVNALFKLIYTNDRDLRLFYEYFIEHGVMFPKLAANEHARYLVSIYRVLNEEAHKAFKRWLSDKAIFVKYFDAFLKLVSINPEDSRLDALNQHLSNQYRLPLPAQSMLKAFPSTLVKDKVAFEQFRRLVLPDQSIKSQKEIVESLTTKNWEKTDARLKEYLITFTVRRASMLSVNSEILTAILDLGQKELQLSARKLITDIITEFPALGVSHSGILQDAIMNDRENLAESLSSYARLVMASMDKITISEDFLVRVFDLIQNGKRRQVKYAVQILLAFKSKWQVLSSILHDIQLDNIEDAALIRNWQILVEAANQPAVMGPSELLGIKERASELINKLASTSETWPIHKLGLSLDNYSSLEIAAVLAIRCIRNLLISLRHLDQSQEMEQLRIFAPLFVEWLSAVQSPRVQLALAKALVGFVPRPTATTVVTNLNVLFSFFSGCPAIIRNRLNTFIVRQYQLGHIGMIYLAIPVLSCETNQDRSSITEALKVIRRTDRWADSVIPHDDRVIEITSRALRRYEDWFIITLIITALQPSQKTLNEDQLALYTNLVGLLTDVVATELNISYLFDAVVQLKRYEFVSEHSSHNKILYILSELSQNALRSVASARKWLLQSIKAPISLTEDLLHELQNVEEMGKNVHRSYLIRATQQIEKRGRESGKLDEKGGGKGDEFSEKRGGESGKFDEKRGRKSDEFEEKRGRENDEFDENATVELAKTRNDKVDESSSREGTPKKLWRSVRRKKKDENISTN